MSHKSSSLNQGKFFNKKINSYKPLEKYESDILDISNKQYPYYNAKYREGFDAVNDADEIYDKENGKEWIILTGYQLKFSALGPDDQISITAPSDDSNTSGGSEGKQSIYTLGSPGFDLLTVLKEASEDSNIYAAKIDKTLNKLYLYRKNASDNIPHATNSGQKIYPRVFPNTSETPGNVHLLLRPGNGEIPENLPFSLGGNDAIMKRDGGKAIVMDKLQKEFNVQKRAYKKAAGEYLEEKMKQYKKRGAIKTNVLYKLDSGTYTYITPHAVKRNITFPAGASNKVKALSDAKCPEPIVPANGALPADDDNMVQSGDPIILANGEECGAGGYIVNKLDTQGNATDDYGWVDHLGAKYKLTGGKPGNFSIDAANGKKIYDPHISCQAYMPSKKISSTRWGAQFANATDMNAAAACSVAGADDLAAKMKTFNDKMLNIIGDKDTVGSMFHLASTQSGDTDDIDKLRNTIRTGGSLVPPKYPTGHEHEGQDNPEGEWSSLKAETGGENGLKRPLSVVSNLLKKKKKVLQQERAEVNGLRTSNDIKTRQVDGMSLHYVAWVLAGLAIGGIVVKNLTKKAI